MINHDNVYNRMNTTGLFENGLVTFEFQNLQSFNYYVIDLHIQSYPENSYPVLRVVGFLFIGVVLAYTK
jgi:hypothetical protein